MDPAPERDRARQRAVVDAFFAAGRARDFDALIAVLHPDVVARSDSGPSHPERSTVIRGGEAVAGRARLGAEVLPVFLNGTAGVVSS